MSYSEKEYDTIQNPHLILLDLFDTTDVVNQPPLARRRFISLLCLHADGDTLNHDYLLIDLQELNGGNVLVGPKVSEEMGAQSTEIMIGFNREERPWKSELHFHERSKEFYIILNGGLTFRVGDESVRLRRNQMLVVKEGIPHTIEDFDLPIEFFTIRAPAIKDKVVLKENL